MMEKYPKRGGFKWNGVYRLFIIYLTIVKTTTCIDFSCEQEYPAI